MALTSQQLKGWKKLHFSFYMTIFVMLLLASCEVQGIVDRPREEKENAIESSFLSTATDDPELLEKKGSKKIQKEELSPSSLLKKKSLLSSKSNKIAKQRLEKKGSKKIQKEELSPSSLLKKKSLLSSKSNKIAKQRAKDIADIADIKQTAKKIAKRGFADLRRRAIDLRRRIAEDRDQTEDERIRRKGRFELIDDIIVEKKGSKKIKKELKGEIGRFFKEHDQGFEKEHKQEIKNFIEFILRTIEKLKLRFLREKDACSIEEKLMSKLMSLRNKFDMALMVGQVKVQLKQENNNIFEDIENDLFNIFEIEDFEDNIFADDEIKRKLLREYREIIEGGTITLLGKKDDGIKLPETEKLKKDGIKLRFKPELKKKLRFKPELELLKELKLKPELELKKLLLKLTKTEADGLLDILNKMLIAISKSNADRNMLKEDLAKFKEMALFKAKLSAIEVRIVLAIVKDLDLRGKEVKDLDLRGKEKIEMIEAILGAKLSAIEVRSLDGIVKDLDFTEKEKIEEIEDILKDFEREQKEEIKKRIQALKLEEEKEKFLLNNLDKIMKLSDTKVDIVFGIIKFKEELEEKEIFQTIEAIMDS